MSAAAKYLIVNADDFGQSSGVNRRIIEAHERGIVTSASLMVRWPAAAPAAAFSVDALIEILEALRPGVTELGCHPDDGADLDSTYREERAQEVKVLCDPRVRAAIRSEGIELWSFRQALLPRAELSATRTRAGMEG